MCAGSSVFDPLSGRDTLFVRVLYGFDLADVIGSGDEFLGRVSPCEHQLAVLRLIKDEPFSERFIHET